jgi:hypothetical protein
VTARKATTDHRSWETLDDPALLRLRFRDLGLRFSDAPIHRDAWKVVDDLARRNIDFRPHFWFSTDWFSPDGVPGIAVPFFLGHPRLLRLERRMMGEAEGGNRNWRLRLLRHELGHAVDTAFGLRRRRDWQRVFGSPGAPYSRDYTVRPLSRNHVLHLEHWYAQSHPTEDFAETFAVWLQPKARWHATYAAWPALAKLEFVDTLMSEIAGRAPARRDRSVVSPIAANSRTLGEHYRRRSGLAAGIDPRHDRGLLRVFAPRESKRDVAAERWLREIKPRLMQALLRRTGVHPYVAHQVLRSVRQRARALDLTLRGQGARAETAVLKLHERAIADLRRRNEESFRL